MADRVGQQLGNYRLLRLLGEGGFAEVYLGEHLYLNTPAAIKVLHTRLAKDDLDSFLSEARTIAALKHPHIVRVLDFGVEGGTPFLVMDFAPGGTLRERIPRGTQLSPVAILPIVRQVADALQYAHDRRLIHRDVKPENMLLDERQQIMLSDFGIATIAQSSRYQQTEGVAGTAAYMAPEQLQGKPRPASDQYSLGIVIYEWLTGARPFQGSFAEIASQHLFVPPLPLSEKLSAISPAVEQAVLRALAKDPRERFASAQEFAAALEQASQMNQPTLIRPAPELPPSLPAVAPPVTTPQKRAAWVGPTPVASGPFAPTRRTPPQPDEPAPRVQGAASPLAPTMRAAAPSTVPAPIPSAPRRRSMGLVLHYLFWAAFAVFLAASIPNVAFFFHSFEQDASWAWPVSVAIAVSIDAAIYLLSWTAFQRYRRYRSWRAVWEYWLLIIICTVLLLAMNWTSALQFHSNALSKAEDLAPWLNSIFPLIASAFPLLGIVYTMIAVSAGQPEPGFSTTIHPGTYPSRSSRGFFRSGVGAPKMFLTVVVALLIVGLLFAIYAIILVTH